MEESDINERKGRKEEIVKGKTEIGSERRREAGRTLTVRQVSEREDR